MTQSNTCTVSGENCTISATLNVSTITENPSVTFTVSSSGEVTLTDSSSETSNLYLVKEGNFAVSRDVPDSDGELGLGLHTRRGSGFSVASLNGAYNFAGLEQIFETTGTTFSGTNNGAISFDGSGGVSLSGVYVGGSRNQCNSASCPFVSVAASSEIFSDTGTYTVSDIGEVTLNFTSPDTFTIMGTLNADGKILVMKEVVDNQAFGNGSESLRSFSIALKQ